MEKDFMDIDMAISRDIAEEIAAIVNKDNTTLGVNAESALEEARMDEMRDYALDWDIDPIYGDVDV
jgi:hypothetical protein